MQDCTTAPVAVVSAAPASSKETIAVDPDASRFALSGPLRRCGRLKGMGLPNRYRLFFRPFEAEGRRLLLLNTIRCTLQRCRRFAHHLRAAGQRLRA